MNPLSNDCRVMVTGGGGFIGVNLIRKLLSEGYEVLNFDKLTYAANPLSLEPFQSAENYQFIKGDVANRDQIRDAVLDFEPECIFHLAAESHVDRSIISPLEFVHTNIIGTACLLDAAVSFWKDLSADKKSRFRLIHISSDEVFGTLGVDEKFDECSRYAPRSPYSASKAGSDHLVRAWHQTYGLPVIVCNSSNNYGPYQFPEKLIPMVILAGILGNPIPVYGTGENIRDWIHVDDHCEALLRIMKNGNIGEDYLIGDGSEVSNLDLIHQLLEVVERVSRDYGSPLSGLKSLVEFVPDRPGHDFRYAVDSIKARTQLGWQPKLDFTQGLESTVRWYFENRLWWETIFGRG